MKTRFLTFFFFLVLFILQNGCNSCDKDQQDTGIPKSLEGFVLSGKVTSATGVFEGLSGYTFESQFEKNRTFLTTSANQTESRGDFSYTRIDDKSARLTLIDRSTNHSGEQLEVTLSFETPTSGTYSSHYLSEKVGEEKGTFELTRR